MPNCKQHCTITSLSYTYLVISYNVQTHSACLLQDNVLVGYTQLTQPTLVASGSLPLTHRASKNNLELHNIIIKSGTASSSLHYTHASMVMSTQGVRVMGSILH